ncbi:MULTISPECIES: alcohol dehydrogenase catalytic domain-containing protein [unclassified Streptomyces]|uniref:alcohol dehydrogenase catalytic domain-containing protein n=1 Tax=unclassified Streptomyces TaxID=2593676 RepID=UPI0022528DF3|nr:MULTISPECIES: alcohol dehydrogenase catalytic domain-containing protein [unclassified Streptomyces]MCX5063224.1 alcohol dehydrogenase catalytic domain-containing protein [Streptomyces sp. NBC_00452]
MLAARLYGAKDLRIEEMPEPEPGPGEVKIRVAYAGICGTDTHEYFETPRATHQPNPLTGAVLPQTLGHEFAGTVVACGEGVDRVAPGVRACVRPIRTCGECPRCTDGLPHLCTFLAAIGVTSPGGGLAQYVLAPADSVHPLPDGLSLEQGALVEPMAVALNAVERAHVPRGGSALVTGAGAVGMGALFALRAHGVRDVFVSEPSPSRRAAAERHGARVLDPGEVDVVEEVMAGTRGRGVDAAVECAGRPDALNAAIRSVAAQAPVVMVALYSGPVAIDASVVRLAELALLGAEAYPDGVFERVVEHMAAGHYPTDGWLDHIPLKDTAAGLRDVREGRRLKVLVDLPGGLGSPTAARA